MTVTMHCCPLKKLPTKLLQMAKLQGYSTIIIVIIIIKCWKGLPDLNGPVCCFQFPFFQLLFFYFPIVVLSGPMSDQNEDHCDHHA